MPVRSLSVLLCATLLLACSSYKQNVRYKLTFWVEESGRVYAASSVIEAHPRVDHTIDGDFYNDEERGEAPFIVLGSSRMVVMLLGRWPTHGGKDPLPLLAQGNGVITLKPEQSPEMASFLHPNEPSNFEFVYPTEPHGVLGDTIRFRGATIQLTKEPITTGLTRALPWT